MDCKTFEEQILDGLDLNKDTSGAKALEEHLASCSSCKAFQQVVYSGLESMGSGRRSVNDPELFQSIQNKRLSSGSGIASRPNQVAKIVRISAPVAMAAASVLLGIWLGGRILTYTAQPNEETVSVNTAPELYALEIHMNDESSEFIENYLSGN
ncbi:MAG: zf-HC2 domain-containing protein [Lentimicrobium sp.]|nr:zf-HC2 domain-containing protein [Lentimicrobium sp.]